MPGKGYNLLVNHSLFQHILASNMFENTLALVESIHSDVMDVLRYTNRIIKTLHLALACQNCVEKVIFILHNF